ncbi:hypothetical protein EVAR_100749_1 [Eumeta japonica]|uniref:Uncharacterized protein n=1 Tax=Eumeta variegata TaxID=151549 RepID=A0A4C1ZAV4_EUMVA|nr:hypothetical protein EVAR_100749_1 [Eumeta japonica]
MSRGRGQLPSPAPHGYDRVNEGSLIRKVTFIHPQYFSELSKDVPRHEIDEKENYLTLCRPSRVWAAVAARGAPALTAGAHATRSAQPRFAPIVINGGHHCMGYYESVTSPPLATPPPASIKRIGPLGGGVPFPRAVRPPQPPRSALLT